jgi:SRSO17 transposase
MLANGVVAVTAYGVLDTVTFPLAFRLSKPQRRLKPGAVYKSKPQLAVELIEELAAQGIHVSVVLADSG